MNYHIMVDDKFIDPFMEDMIELGFLNNNNRYYVRGDINNRKYVFSEEVTWLSYGGIIDLLKSIHQTDKLYIHWYDFYMGELCLKFLNPKVELSAILWGGEFFQEPEWYHLFRILERKTLWEIIKVNCFPSNYNGLTNFKIFLKTISHDFKKYKEKKIQVARVDNILVHLEDSFDVKLIEKIYGNKFRKHVPFFYQYNFEYAKSFQNNNSGSNSLKILVGNSFNHSNNHFDAFDKLSKVLKEPYQIHCPLSYGSSVVVRDLVIKYGKRLFGNSFYPVMDYLNVKNYLELLNEMDAVYFDHIRSQAFGNIVMLLSMGKPVFMNKKNTLYLMFVNMGISGIYSIDRFIEFIKNKSEFKVDVNRNSVLLEKSFSKSTRLDFLNEAIAKE